MGTESEKKLTEEQKAALEMIMPNKLCIHCIHKKRREVNSISHRSQIYCEMQPSKKTACGHVIIKAHDYACGLYEHMF